MAVGSCNRPVRSAFAIFSIFFIPVILVWPIMGSEVLLEALGFVAMGFGVFKAGVVLRRWVRVWGLFVGLSFITPIIGGSIADAEIQAKYETAFAKAPQFLQDELISKLMKRPTQVHWAKSQDSRRNVWVGVFDGGGIYAIQARHQSDSWSLFFVCPEGGTLYAALKDVTIEEKDTDSDSLGHIARDAVDHLRPPSKQRQVVLKRPMPLNSHYISRFLDQDGH